MPTTIGSAGGGGGGGGAATGGAGSLAVLTGADLTSGTDENIGDVVGTGKVWICTGFMARIVSRTGGTALSSLGLKGDAVTIMDSYADLDLDTVGEVVQFKKSIVIAAGVQVKLLKGVASDASPHTANITLMGYEEDA